MEDVLCFVCASRVPVLKFAGALRAGRMLALTIVTALGWSGAAPRARPASRSACLPRHREHVSPCVSMLAFATADLGQSKSPPRSDHALFGMKEVYERLSHGSSLPPAVAKLIGRRNRQILSFVLEYLASDAGLANVPVYSSGGFVRDLLLGRQSDDLDLTLDLRTCAPDVTIDTIAQGMPDFAASAGGVVDSVTIVTAMSASATSKSVDAAQVRMVIGEDSVVVDLMPTIAKEHYDPHDRIPRREGRGTARQDTMRRDLTINAMLLEVSTPAGSAGEDGEALHFRLLDFHGGLDDLRTGVLRVPCPQGDAARASALELLPKLVSADKRRRIEARIEGMLRRQGDGSASERSAADGGTLADDLANPDPGMVLPCIERK